MHMGVSLPGKGPIHDQPLQATMHSHAELQNQLFQIASHGQNSDLSSVPNLSPGLSALTHAEAAQTSQVSPGSANWGVHREREGGEGNKAKLLPHTGRMA